MITTIINNRSNITSIVRTAGCGQLASNVKPNFCAYTGDDANNDFQLSSKGHLASSAMLFQGGDISEWSPHLLVEADYTSAPHTAEEVMYDRVGRVDSETFAAVYLADPQADMMFVDEQGKHYTQKIGRVNHRISDADSRMTTSAIGSTGVETFNWPLYYSSVDPTPSKVSNDGFGTTDGSDVKTLIGRIIKEDNTHTGDMPCWIPAMVIDCNTIETVLDLNGSILSPLYTSLSGLAAKFNTIRASLAAEGALTQGYPPGLDWTAPTENYACTTASVRTAGTNDVQYY